MNNEKKTFNVEFSFVEQFIGGNERKIKYTTTVTAQSAEEALEKAKERGDFSKQGLGSNSTAYYEDRAVERVHSDR